MHLQRNGTKIAHFDISHVVYVGYFLLMPSLSHSFAPHSLKFRNHDHDDDHHRQNHRKQERLDNICFVFQRIRVYSKNIVHYVDYIVAIGILIAKHKLIIINFNNMLNIYFLDYF